MSVNISEWEKKNFNKGGKKEKKTSTASTDGHMNRRRHARFGSV